jgi:hypothetical protein
LDDVLTLEGIPLSSHGHTKKQRYKTSRYITDATRMLGENQYIQHRLNVNFTIKKNM